jgi:hypothetical protein
MNTGFTKFDPFADAPDAVELAQRRGDPIQPFSAPPRLRGRLCLMKRETFFEKFDLFADAPDAVAKMREWVGHVAGVADPGKFLSRIGPTPGSASPATPGPQPAAKARTRRA